MSVLSHKNLVLEVKICSYTDHMHFKVNRIFLQGQLIDNQLSALSSNPECFLLNNLFCIPLFCIVKSRIFNLPLFNCVNGTHWLLILYFDTWHRISDHLVELCSHLVYNCNQSIGNMRVRGSKKGSRMDPCKGFDQQKLK